MGADRNADWNIEDILAEAQMLKEKRLKTERALRESEQSSASRPAIPEQEVASPSARKVNAAAQIPAPHGEQSVVQPPLREHTLVSVKKEKEPEAPVVILPETDQEDVRIYTPRSRSEAAEDMPAVVHIPPKADIRPIKLTREDHPTKILDTRRMKKIPDKESEEDGQLQLDAFVEPEDDGDAAVEERLRQSRREKVSRFQLLREETESGFKFSGDDEEENDPSEEPEIYEDEELEDYSSYEETEAVASELVYRRRTGWFCLLMTGLLETVLLFISVVVAITGAPPLDPILYVAMNGAILLLMMMFNHRMVGGGIASLFRLQADSDSAVSAASLFVLLHTALQFFNPSAVSAGNVEILTSVAGMALLLGAAGKQMRIGRIVENFRFVSYRGDKYAAHVIEDRDTAVEVGRAAVALGDPLVAYYKKTGFLTGFLEHSYAEDGCDRTLRLFVPSVMGISLAGAVVYGLVSGNWLNAATLFVAAVCLSSPIAAVTAGNFPLLRASKRVLRRGGMLSGWEAVRQYGDMHALTVDAQDLFPSESVRLHGIKTFSGTRIDEAIMDAAAVSIRAGGPLSNVFRRVIENKVDILQDVDTLVYEQDMGLSGWVGGRRVLVGSRRLLENHGVDVPSSDYEKRYMRDGRQLVYLSIAGELSAMFVVSYLADEGIARSLYELTRSGITVLVRTCDPNVTEDMICDLFDLDRYYVEILGAAAGRTYQRLTSGCTEEEPAVLASNGRIEGMAAALTCCRRLRKAVPLAAAVQIVGGILGCVCGVFLMFYTGVPLPPLYILAYLLVWTMLSWVLPLFRRV